MRAKTEHTHLRTEYYYKLAVIKAPQSLGWDVFVFFQIPLGIVKKLAVTKALQSLGWDIFFPNTFRHCYKLAVTKNYSHQGGMFFVLFFQIPFGIATNYSSCNKSTIVTRVGCFFSKYLQVLLHISCNKSTICSHLGGMFFFQIPLGIVTNQL